MDKLIKSTQGKKTYAVVALALVYVVVNAVLGQEVNVEVLTTALAAAGLRYAIK